MKIRPLHDRILVTRVEAPEVARVRAGDRILFAKDQETANLPVSIGGK